MKKKCEIILFPHKQILGDFATHCTIRISKGITLQRSKMILRVSELQTGMIIEDSEKHMSKHSFNKQQYQCLICECRLKTLDKAYCKLGRLITVSVSSINTFRRRIKIYLLI